MNEKPGMFETWLDLAGVVLLGLGAWALIGALGYSAWLWLR